MAAVASEGVGAVAAGRLSEGRAASGLGVAVLVAGLLVRMVADGVPADVSEHFLAQAGPAYAVMLRLLRGRHARREHRVFRFA